MATEWYLKLADRELGPFTADQLKAMAERGQIAPFDPVRRGEQGGWVAAGCVKGLLNGARPAGDDSSDGLQCPTDDSPPAIAVVPSRTTVATSSRWAKRRMNATLTTVLVVAMVFAVACIAGYSLLTRPMPAPRPAAAGAEPADTADTARQPVPPSKAVDLDLSIVDELTSPKTPPAGQGQTEAPATR